MNFSEMLEAIKEAKDTIHNADSYISNFVEVITGRLRVAGVSRYKLAALKKELRDFNSNTGKWNLR